MEHLRGAFGRTPFSATKFDAAVWPQGPLDLVIQPQVDSGNYFAQQKRRCQALWLVVFIRVPAMESLGNHNFKAGVYAARSNDNGEMIEHPIDIQDASDHISWSA